MLIVPHVDPVFVIRPVVAICKQSGPPDPGVALENRYAISPPKLMFPEVESIAIPVDEESSMDMPAPESMETLALPPFSISIGVVPPSKINTPSPPEPPSSLRDIPVSELMSMEFCTFAPK